MRIVHRGDSLLNTTERSYMDYGQSILYMQWMKDNLCNNKYEKDAVDASIRALRAVDKIYDAVDGKIDHFDRDDAMDLLYDIKRILETGSEGLNG